MLIFVNVFSWNTFPLQNSNYGIKMLHFSYLLEGLFIYIFCNEKVKILFKPGIISLAGFDVSKVVPFPEVYTECC